MTDRVGDLIVTRLGLSLESWKHELRWAQIGGHYITKGGQPKTVGSVLASRFCMALSVSPLSCSCTPSAWSTGLWSPCWSTTRT